jgi:PQQ-dependent catabolism-associated CXXCW motif protein
MLRVTVLITALLLSCADVGTAATYAEHQARRPDLFDPATGLRIGRQRAPTPDDIPGPALLIAPEEAQNLMTKGALVLDVFGAQQSRFDELDGTWLVSKQRLSLPGAVWLPEVGRGRLSDVMQRYLKENLARLTAGDHDRAIIVFCVADCWMSWNAAQRIAGLGYTRVHWFRLGTDGWLDIGADLIAVDPEPVNVD